MANVSGQAIRKNFAESSHGSTNDTSKFYTRFRFRDPYDRFTCTAVSRRTPVADYGYWLSRKRAPISLFIKWQFKQPRSSNRRFCKPHHRILIYSTSFAMFLWSAQDFTQGDFLISRFEFFFLCTCYPFIIANYYNTCRLLQRYYRLLMKSDIKIQWTRHVKWNIA